MDKVKGKFGFGMMRLPMNGNEVDIEQTKKMVDLFIASGFNYFDTAHGYIDGKSEIAVREALTSRYPRDSYILTDKLTSNFFSKQEDIKPVIEEQLKACGVEYFDYLLMHAQGSSNYEQYQRCRAYETALELKKEGKIRHLGISFHDSAAFLDKILTDHPEVEVVQLQLNYLDWDDKGVQSGPCYEVASKHGKEVIVMEPVKGGRLASLPKAASKGLVGSPASYALRFCASLENVKMILSGMSSLVQMEDNVITMGQALPLNEAEKEKLEEIKAYLRAEKLIECTHCSYCEPVCPVSMPIPDLFAKENKHRASLGTLEGSDKGQAASCLRCGACEEKCPQHLPIRELLSSIAE